MPHLAGGTGRRIKTVVPVSGSVHALWDTAATTWQWYDRLRKLASRLERTHAREPGVYACQNGPFYLPVRALHDGPPRNLKNLAFQF